ncbi:hypothetical protein FMM56_05970 [Campylobacter sp. LR264d]|nr:hypothetical protein FMM56_05970 [Campylobacter sp. LR264d]
MLMFVKLFTQDITIMKKYPDQAHDMLKDFSAKLKDTITDKTLKEYFNVLIESTFRDPNVPIKILNELKNMDIKGIF